MWRSWLRVLCLAGGVSAAGCADHGSFQVSWGFVDEPDATIGCGKHGVDSIRVTGTSTGGDSAGVTALCVNGSLTHEVPVGTWTFEVQQQNVRGQRIVVDQVDAQGQPVLDAGGNPIPVPDPTVTGDIAKDARTDFEPAVVLTPPPECSDGVDNDIPPDGRVDLDDPDCVDKYSAEE